MPANADILIRASADTDQAVRGLAQVENKLSAVSKSSTAYQRAIRNGYALPPGFSDPTASASASTASTLGKTIGLAAAGYIANATVGSLATVVGSLPGGTRDANRISRIGGGILTGAAAGAAIGSVVPGLGTAIGAGAGALIGGATGIIETLATESKSTRDNLYAINHSIGITARSTALNQEDQAFQLSLGYLSRQDRIAKVQSRAQEIYGGGGSGEDSIYALRREQSLLARENKTDTYAYKENAEKLATQLSRYAALQQQAFALSVAPEANLLAGSDVGDTLPRIGGSVGPQVDVQSVNQEQVSLLRQIRDNILSLGETRTDILPAAVMQ